MLTCYRKFGSASSSRVPSDYVVNRCFSYPLDGENTLITTNHGGWAILTREEYNLLLEGAVEKNTNLYADLDRTGIILTRDNQTDILRISCEQHAYLNQAPNRLVLWDSGSEPEGASDETHGDKFEEVSSKAIDFFLSIPQLHDRVHIEFRGELLYQYDLIQKVMNYAMHSGWRNKKEVRFTLVSSPHFMTNEIAMDIALREVSYQAYFDGSALAFDGLRKFQPYLGGGRVLSVQLIVFPSDHIGQESRLVRECVALGLNRVTVKYAATSHPVEKYQRTDLTPAAYYHFWKDTLEWILQYNRNGVPLVEGQTKAFLQNIIAPSAASPGTRRPCGAGVSQLVVDLAGRILACYCAEWLEMGNVFTDTYDAVITSENGFATRCMASDLLPKCSTCAFNAYCGHCPIRSLQQHGTSLLEEPDDFECQSYIRMIPYLFKKLGNVEDAKILTKWV